MKTTTIAALCLSLLLPRAVAIPQTIQVTQATLTPNGAVLVRPYQEITLKFDVQGDRLINPTVVSPEPEQRNTITIALRRSGGATNYLGTTATRDYLEVISRFDRQLTARCSYTDADSPKPQRGGLVPDERGLHRAFPKGVTEVTLTEFGLGPAKRPK